jgi:hypothetical protein
MQNFEDIKTLWSGSRNTAALPDAELIIKKTAAARKKIIRRNVLAGICLVLTFAFITWIGLHYDFEYLSTSIGILLTLTAIIIGVLFNSRLVFLLMKKNDPTLDSRAFLEQMLKFRATQRKVQSTGITVYFILLTVGIMLYMYEFAGRSFGFGLAAYSITLGWIAFNWLYLRKRTIRKQEKELNEQIDFLERLSEQFRKD